MKRNTILRYMLVAALLTVGLGYGQNSWAADVTDRVIAIVNSDVITMSDLIREGGSDMKGAPDAVLKNGMTVKQAQDIVLEQIIMKKLLDQAVKEEGLDVTELDVDRAIAEQMKFRGLTKQDLSALLAKEGKTYEEYRIEVEYSIKKERLIARKLSSHIIVTDDEISKYFNEHKADFANRKEYRISEIVFAIPPDATPEMVAELRNRADMVLKKLKSGADFAEMAKGYSMTADAEKGGDMGFVSTNTLDPGFVSLLEKMKVGQVSDMITTVNGYIIFKITEAKPIENITVKDVESEIYAIIAREKTVKYFEQWMNTLRETAFVQKML